MGGAGSSNTSVLAFGSFASPKATTQTWNGTNWTNENEVNTTRIFMGGAGTRDAALAFGGSPTTGATEEWVYNAVLTENID
jgi:hypothetical protein